jgi:putative ABC transport system substrate-binding protein
MRCLWLTGVFLASIFLWVLFPCDATAQGRIAVLLSEEGGAYTEFSNSLTAALNESGGVKPSIKVLLLGDSKIDDVVGHGSSDLLVAVGASAMLAAAKKPLPMPILNVLVTHEAFLQASLSSGRSLDVKRFSAVFLDQAWARQFALIRLALPTCRRVGILLGKNSAESRASLMAAAKKANLIATVEVVNEEADLLPVLKRLLAHSGALLAVPDPAIYNRNNIASILLTSYRAKVPLFGFSSSYVKAGALAAIYSHPAQIGQQVAEIIQNLPASRNLPAPLSPRYFSVGVNSRVKLSLELEFDDEAELLRKLKQFAESPQ